MGIETTLRFHTKEVVKSIEHAAVKRMLEATAEVRSVVLETLSGNRTGRTYKVPGTRRTYTASSPGQPPAQRIGELRQSVKTSVEVEDKVVIGLVGTERVQGKHLEYGTRNMEARPWLKVSFEKAMPKLKEILGKTWF